jgi:hypothetical protein
MTYARPTNPNTSISSLWLGHATRELSVKDWKTDDSGLEDNGSHNAMLVEPGNDDGTSRK